MQNVNKEEKKKDAVEEAAAAGADGDKKDVVGVKQEAVKVEQEVRVVSAKVEVKEEQEERPVDGQPAGGKEKERPDRGRLVMTIAGEQKMLHFDPIDVMTSATMMVGDKVSHWGGSINNSLINCQPQGHTPTSADRE